MVYTRKTTRADASPEYPPRNQHKINIREVQTPSLTVITPEQNELFVQKVVQDNQSLQVEVLYYYILGFNEYETENDLKKYYRKLALQSRSDKNKYPQASNDCCTIKEVKQGLEGVLRHNDKTRRTQEREKDLQRQEEY